MNENVILSASNTLCSEYSEDLASLSAKFLICTFEPNKNNVMLNRKTILNWLSTLISQPVVSKISLTDSGIGDFTSHNLNAVIREDENGKPYTDYEFNSEACGVFTDVSIETIGGKECITATAKLWKRFPNFIAIVKRRLSENQTISTSWEIATKKSHYEMIDGKKIKVIDDGQFLGHSMLSRIINPAYKESQLLEVAQDIQDDVELIDALSKDISDEQSSNIINSSEKEDKELPNENIENKDESLENADVNITENTDDTNDNKEISALTEYDLRKAVRKAIASKLNVSEWDFYPIYNFPSEFTIWIQIYNAKSELDITIFTYTVENDVVTVSEPTEGKLTVSVSQINSTIAELNQKIEEQTNSLVEAGTKITELSTEISNLAPFKEKFDQAEQERVASELATSRDKLKAKAIKSGFITEEEISTSDELKAYIENVDEKSIGLVIADRVMKSLDDKPNEVSEVETSETKPKANIETAQVKFNINDDGEDNYNPKAIMKKFLNK